MRVLRRSIWLGVLLVAGIAIASSLPLGPSPAVSEAAAVTPLEGEVARGRSSGLDGYRVEVSAGSSPGERCIGLVAPAGRSASSICYLDWQVETWPVPSVSVSPVGPSGDSKVEGVGRQRAAVLVVGAAGREIMSRTTTSDGRSDEVEPDLLSLEQIRMPGLVADVHVFTVDYDFAASEGRVGTHSPPQMEVEYR